MNNCSQKISAAPYQDAAKNKILKYFRIERPSTAEYRRQIITSHLEDLILYH